MNDLIESIKNAEEQASAIKAEAYEKAAKIAADAAQRAVEIAKVSDEENKRFRENLLAQATKQAEDDYAFATQAAKTQAKAYADSILENTDIVVGKIVGRVCRGNS